MKEVIGPSDKFSSPSPKPGYSVWIEYGIYYTALTIDEDKFGGHEYENGGYDRGINKCSCGCYMYSSSSGGPVDPWGPCPNNPLATEELNNLKTETLDDRKLS